MNGKEQVLFLSLSLLFLFLFIIITTPNNDNNHFNTHIWKSLFQIYTPTAAPHNQWTPLIHKICHWIPHRQSGLIIIQNQCHSTTTHLSSTLCGWWVVFCSHSFWLCPWLWLQELSMLMTLVSSAPTLFSSSPLDNHLLPRLCMIVSVFSTPPLLW